MKKFMILILLSNIFLNLQSTENLSKVNGMLVDAAKTGNIGYAKKALAKGAEINVRGGILDYTPLHWAAIKGNLGMIQWLFEHGADINARDKIGETPLHNAIRSGDINAVKWLVEHGGIVNATNKGDLTPFDLATQLEEKAIANWLIENQGQAIEQQHNKHQLEDALIQLEDALIPLIEKALRISGGKKTYQNEALILVKLTHALEAYEAHPEADPGLIKEVHAIQQDLRNDLMKKFNARIVDGVERHNITSPGLWKIS